MSTTISGNVTRDPELRFTNTGQPTCSFSVAVNRRWMNKTTNEWEEATSFVDVVAWRGLAENAAESLTKGSRVLVHGRLEQRSWEKDGQHHSKMELVADDIGPSLLYATAQVAKVQRSGERQAAPSQTAPTRDPAARFDDEPF